MAKVPFIVDIDLTKNQLLNAALQNLVTHPAAPVDGQIYYNTTDETTYVYAPGNADSDGSGWLDLGAIYTHPTYTARNPTLTGANVLATLTSDASGHVTAATTRVLTLADLGYTGTLDANTYVHPSYTAQDSGALAGVQVVSRVTSDTSGHVTAVTTRSLTNSDINSIIINDALSTSSTFTWSVDKIQSFIASAVSGQMVYIGGYAATAAPPTGTGVKQGYTYTVTAASAGAGQTFWGAETLQVGDMIVAEQDNPTLAEHWTVINKNIPDIVNASETARGIIELATQAEVDAGVDTERAVTPATLASRLSNFDAADNYSETFGNGVLQSFTITHNLNTADVHVSVREVASGLRVEVQWVVSSVNAIVISTNSVPTSNFYRVTVQK